MVILAAVKKEGTRALRQEWLLENKNGYLAQPSFEAAVALTAEFMKISPVMAAQVVEKWVAGEKSSVAEFKRRFNDDFDELMLKLRWDKFRFSFRLAVKALIDEVESKPKVTWDDSAFVKWNLDVQQKVDAEMPPWMRTKTYLEFRRSIERDATAAASL